MLPGLPSFSPGRPSCTRNIASLTSVFSTFARRRGSIHFKGFTDFVTPLLSTLTKNMGVLHSRPEPFPFRSPSADACSVPSLPLLPLSPLPPSPLPLKKRPYPLTLQCLTHTFRHNRGVPPWTVAPGPGSQPSLAFSWGSALFPFNRDGAVPSLPGSKK